ncbi:MAG: ABC-type Fe3+-siderophore transport system permease [Desulfobulbaceae bacterium]|nr:MAG: ABC-type Fe3+-siderophore transport system permease [Desulfobulbaceae bacterium]
MKNKSTLYVLIVLSPFLMAWCAMFIGAYQISPLLVLKCLMNEIIPLSGMHDLPERGIILDIRLPRILLAGIVGIALSGSGVTLQGVFRNPLVDPFILGLSAGAAFGCAVSIGFFPAVPIQVSAFVFSIASVLLAYNIAKCQGEVSRLPLILSGVIISAFFSALTSIIKFLCDPHKLQNIVFWLMGSFSLADWHTISLTGIGILIALCPVYLMRWRLNVISMGDDEAKLLGVNIRRDRLIFVVASTLAVSLAVSVSGIIGWVGLMVPHLVRMMTGPDHKSLVPLSMAAGATFMIFADTMARSLTTYDIPVGIITAVSGAPFFIYLMKKGGKESWGK